MDASVKLGPPGMSVAVGDHICAFYRGSSGRDEILLPYLRAGIEAGDKCIAILDGIQRDQVHAGLQADCEVEDAILTRQLDLLCSSETYLRDGQFSKVAMLDFWNEVVGECIGLGDYEFSRSVGEMTWALSQLPGVEDLVDYESELNRFLPLYPQVILCLYDLDRFDGRIVVDLMRTHPKLLLCGSILDNPYYLEPDQFHSRGASVPSR